MRACTNQQILDLMTFNKLKSDFYLTFNVSKKLNPCNRINTKNYISTSAGVNVTYNEFLRPTNALECARTICHTTGVLTLDAEGRVGFKHNANGITFAGGVITMYLKSPAAQTVKVYVTSEPITGMPGELINANVYEIKTNEDSTTMDKNGFEFAMIQLTREPDDVVGTGFTPKKQGTYIYLETELAETGVSTIDVWETINDLQIDDVIKVGCVSELGNEIAVEADDATCWNSGYSSEPPSLEINATGKSVTPNYWKLNPMMGEGEKIYGGKPSVMTQEVEEGTHPTLGRVGKIIIADVFQDDCGYINAQIADECVKDLSMLDRISVPTIDALTPKQFIIHFNYETGITELIFNEQLIGMEIEVMYNQKVEVIDRVAREDNIGGVAVRMTYEVTDNKGVKYLYVYDNVLVTSFPNTINQDETEFEFTFKILKDNYGNAYRVQRVLTDN